MKNLDFGEKLTQARKAKGWTQMNLAEKSNISLRTIQRIESGQVNPRTYTVKQLSEIIGLNFFEILENSGDSVSKPKYSSFRLLKTILWHISDLFNLKTNTMKKVTILTVITCSIITVLFISTFDLNAQNSKKLKPSKFIITNGRGIIYLFPRGEKFRVSNVKDTADLFVGKHLIQEFNNKIYFNGELIGNAFPGDTVILDKSSVNIKKLQFHEYSQDGTNGVKYYIPQNFRINNFSFNKDTVHIDFDKHHIMHYKNQVFLNNDFIGIAKKGDKVYFRNGLLEISD